GPRMSAKSPYAAHLLPPEGCDSIAKNSLLPGPRIGLLSAFVSCYPARTPRLALRPDHVRSQPAHLQATDEQIRHIDLVPAVAVRGAARLMVVVVVPALAEGQQGQPPAVAAVVRRGVVPIAAAVAEQVDSEGEVPAHDDAEEQPPDEQRQSQCA